MSKETAANEYLSILPAQPRDISRTSFRVFYQPMTEYQRDRFIFRYGIALNSAHSIEDAKAGAAISVM